VGRREAWWANFLLNALGIIIAALLIIVFLAGLANLHPPS
jgi:hypothetical protein